MIIIHLEELEAILGPSLTLPDMIIIHFEDMIIIHLKEFGAMLILSGRRDEAVLTSDLPMGK